MLLGFGKNLFNPICHGKSCCSLYVMRVNLTFYFFFAELEKPILLAKFVQKIVGHL